MTLNILVISFVLIVISNAVPLDLDIARAPTLRRRGKDNELRYRTPSPTTSPRTRAPTLRRRGKGNRYKTPSPTWTPVGQSCNTDSQCISSSIGCHAEAKVCSECGYQITNTMIGNRWGAANEEYIGDFKIEGITMTYKGTVCGRNKRCHAKDGLCGDILQLGESCFRDIDCKGNMFCSNRGICSVGADVGEACKFTIAGSFSQGFTRYSDNSFGDYPFHCKRYTTSGCMPLSEDISDWTFDTFKGKVRGGTYDGVCRGLTNPYNSCFNSVSGMGDTDLCAASSIIYRRDLPGAGYTSEFEVGQRANAVYVLQGREHRTVLSDEYKQWREHLPSADRNRTSEVYSGSPSEERVVSLQFDGNFLREEPDEWYNQLQICFDTSCGINTKAHDTTCRPPVSIGGECCNQNDCHHSSLLKGEIICFREPKLSDTVMSKDILGKDLEKWSTGRSTKVGICSRKRDIGQTCYMTSDCKSTYECYKYVCHDHQQIDDYCGSYHDCDPILATPTAQDPSDVFFCIHNKCSRRRDRELSCEEKNHCIQPKLACVDNICKPLWMHANPGWEDHLNAVINWVGDTLTLGGTTYCYRDPIQARTCGPSQVQAGFLCWDKCDDGWTAAGPWCFKLLSRKNRMGHGRDFLWWCDAPKYYRDALHCSRTCPPHQSHGCLAGCAVDGDACASVTAGMIMGPIDIVLSVASMGTSKAATMMIRTVKSGLEKVNKVLDKMGDIGTRIKSIGKSIGKARKINDDNHLMDAMTGIKTAFDTLLHFVRNLSDRDIMDKYVRKLMDDHDCGPTRTAQFDSETSCWGEIKKRWTAGVASSIFLKELGEDITQKLNNWLAQTVSDSGNDFVSTISHPSANNIDRFLGNFLTFTNSHAITALSFADPTGILGTVQAYAHPRCKYPAAFPSYSITTVHTFLESQAVKEKKYKHRFVYIFSDSNLRNFTTY